MKCKLCQDEEATKKNTHYLTDSIIRQALNLDGGNKRERGFYFDISNDNNFVDFNFQRSTPMEKFEDETGRQATGEEIEKAKRRLFSVDYVFCPDCEDLFGEIENPFIKDILPKLRDEDLNGKSQITCEDIKLIRLFFFLQLWRTSVCVETFNLLEESCEKLRQFIINHETIEVEELKFFPLSISFLQTKGDKKNYTQNIVGSISDANPYLIFMNDFIIQLYDTENEIKLLDFQGINDEDFKDYINSKEENFKIRILSDDKRKEINLGVMKESIGQPLLDLLSTVFIRLYRKKYHSNPSDEEIRKFFTFIIGDDQKLIHKFSLETIMNKTIEYFTKQE